MARNQVAKSQRSRPAPVAKSSKVKGGTDMPKGGNRKTGKTGGTGNATFQKGSVSKPFPGPVPGERR